MAITDLGLVGSLTAKAAGTSLVVQASVTIPVGTLVHVCCAFDNIASVTAPTVTCAASGGDAPITNHATAIGSGVTTTAGAGIWHQCFRWITTISYAPGQNVCNIQSNQSAVARAAHIEAWTGMSSTLRGTVATGTSTTGSPTVATAGTALVAGDLVIGSVSFENAAQMTGDADTLNGTWDTIVGTFTTGGNAQTNVGTGTQDKVVTATGAQTFNPTGGVGDTVACVYSLVPLPDPTITQAAYRFYADGTENGLVDGYDETNVSVASVAGTAGGDYGQSFLGNGGRLTRARFWLSKTAAPTGNVTARLYAHTGTFGVNGTGTGSPLATATSRSCTTLQSTAQWEYFDFDGTFTLASGTPYVIALTIDSTAGGATSYGDDTTTPTHAGNATAKTTGAWFVGTSDIIFGVYADNSLAAQDTAYTANLSAADANLLLRTRLQSTNTGFLAATDDYQLQYEWRVNGFWQPLTATTEALIDGYDETHATGSSSLYDVGAGYGQSFMGDGRPLLRAGFWMNKLGAPPGTIRAELYAHTGTYGTATGTATGPALAISASRVGSSLLVSPAAQWEAFTFDGTFTPAVGVPYVIAVVVETQGDVVNCVFVFQDTVSPSHPGASQTNTGSGWTSLAARDRIFRVTTNTAPVLPYNSTNLTDGAATTNRLGAGTGSFTAGKVSEDGLVDNLGWPANNYTELLYALTLKQTGLANADTLRFRVLRNGATTGLTYTQVPTIPVTIIRVADATAALTATSTLTATGVSASSAAADLTATSTLTATGIRSGTPISTLSGDFSTAAWTKVGSYVPHPDNGTRLTATLTTAGSVEAVSNWDLTGDTFTWKVQSYPPRGTSSGGTGAYLVELRDNGTANTGYALNRSSLGIWSFQKAGTNVGSNLVDGDILTYGPYCRFRESAGTTYFELSTDGITWTAPPGGDQNTPNYAAGGGIVALRPRWSHTTDVDAGLHRVQEVNGAPAPSITGDVLATYINKTVTLGNAALDTSPPLPIPLGSSDLSVLVVSGKVLTGVTATSATPAGWTPVGTISQTGTAQTTDANGGDTALALYYRTGTYTAPTIVTTGFDSNGSSISVFRSSRVIGGSSWDVSASTQGADKTFGTPLGPISGATGLDVSISDLVLAAAAESRQDGTATTHSIAGMAGATRSANMSPTNLQVTTGNTTRQIVTYTEITAGSSTAVPTLTVVNNFGVTGNAKFLRIRDLTPTGPPTQQATAALTATSTLTATGLRTPQGTAALVATSTLSVTATRSPQGTAALAATSTLTATATKIVVSSVALTAASTLTTTGVGVTLAAAALLASSTLGTSAFEDFSGGLPGDANYGSGGVLAPTAGNPAPSLITLGGDSWFFTGSRFYTVGDFDFSTDLFFIPAKGNAQLTFWLNTGPGGYRGYALRLDSANTTRWVKITGSTLTALTAPAVSPFTGPLAASPPSVSTWYRVRLWAAGYTVNTSITKISDGTTQLQGSLNADPAVAGADGVDALHPASGYFGQLSDATGGTGTYYDNLTLTQGTIATVTRNASANLTATSTLTATADRIPPTTAALTATSTLTANATVSHVFTDPSSLVGLAEWYDADDATTFTFSSGSSVSQWRDKSGAGRHLASGGGTAPSRSGSRSGRTSVVLGGGYLNYTGSSGLNVGSVTVFVVAAESSKVLYAGVMAIYATDTGIDYNEQGAFEIDTGESTYGCSIARYGQAARSYPGGLMPWAVRSAQLRPDGSIDLWTDGVIGTSGSGPGIFGVANGGLVIGGRYVSGAIDPALRLLGDIGEIVIYDRVLTGIERGQVEGYLTAKWTGGASTVTASAALTATSTLTATGLRTVLPTAALTATSTLTATADRIPQASAALTATSTLTATVVRAPQATAALTATSTLTATADRSQLATAALATTSTLTATADRIPQAAASLAATSTLSASADITRLATAALSATSTLVATGTTTGAVFGAASLSAVSTLAATGVREPQAAASLIATSTLVATAVRVPQATASLTVASTLTATADRIPQAAAALTSTSTLTATGDRTAQVTAALAAVATLTATGDRVPQGAASLVATSTVTATGVITQFATAALTATSTLTATSVRISQAAASLTATSSLAATAVQTSVVTASLTAVSTLSTTGVRVPQAAAALTGVSTLVATAVQTSQATAALTAASTLTVAGLRAPQGSAALVATSTLTATAVREPQAAAALTAVSTLVAGGVTTEFATVSLVATSTLTATADRVPQAAASLSAASTLDAAAVVTQFATAALAATSTLTATSVREPQAAASLVATSTLTATAVRDQPAAATLTGVSTLTTVAVAVGLASAPLTATSTMTATSVRIPQAAASLVAASTLDATALRTAPALASLSATSTLTAAPIVTGIGQVAATLAATSTLTTTAIRIPQASASLVATETLTATSVRTTQATVAFAASSTLTTTGVREPQAAASLTAASTLTTTAFREQFATAAFTSVSTLTATATSIGIVSATAALTATSTLGATAVRAPQAAASLVAAATLTATGVRVPQATAALTAVSTLAATGVREPQAAASLIATSMLAATGQRNQPATAALTATSTLTIAPVLAVSPVTATLAATSTLNATAVRVAQATASLSATSTLTSDAVRQPQAAASLTATSTLTVVAVDELQARATMTALATLTAVATLTGRGLPNASFTGSLHGRDATGAWYPLTRLPVP